MLKVENLVKRFGDKYAVNDISFTIGDKEIVGFLGPNGAGKTTVMNILTGYLSYTSGSVTVDCFEILDNPTEAKKLIGYLPEHPPLYPDMTVWEYLCFVYDLKDCARSDNSKVTNRTQHLMEICEKTRLLDVRKTVIRHLSKGYCQRVGIAQALVGYPKIIILDEPTVGLDPKQITEIRALIRSLGKEHSIILSNHILSEVQAVCNRIIIVNKGRIVADELTEDLDTLLAGAKRLSVQICGPKSEVLTGLRAIDGVVSVDPPKEAHDSSAYEYKIDSEKGADVRVKIFELCKNNDWPIVGMETVRSSLENVFLKLTETKETKNSGKGNKKKANN